MQRIKIASPLFIVREDARRDLFGTLAKIADAGFEAVEFVGFFEKSIEEIREMLTELDISAIGNHVSLTELMEDSERIIENHKLLGCSYITIGWPSADINPKHNKYKETLYQIGEMAEKIKNAGLIPLYHNHNFELREEDWIEDIFNVCEEKGLHYEPDLGWIAAAGRDPAYYLKKYKKICPVIHLKDIYAEDLSKIGAGVNLTEQKDMDPQIGKFAFRPTGYGMINIPRLMPLCLACNPEWFVADHDCAYTRDAYDELKLSLDYIHSLLDMY